MDKMVIDTNVFISGLLFGGKPEQILKSWAKNEFILCISPELQAEIVNKLQIKFKVSSKIIDDLIVDLEEQAKKFLPHANVSLLRDPNDNLLLELADEAKADYLISGDKDVLIIKEYKGTKIISPAEFFSR